MANVFTAFGVGLFGLIISFGLLVIETITAKYGSGGCKNIMNAIISLANLTKVNGQIVEH